MNQIDKTFLKNQLIFFVTFPIVSLIYSVFNLGNKYSKYFIALFFSIIGFLATSEGDLKRYEFWFYSINSSSLVEIVLQYTTFSKSDIYVDILSLLTGYIFPTHHFYFAIAFYIFGYLLSSLLFEFHKIVFSKGEGIRHYGLFFTLLFISFILSYSIRSVISMRFYTGGLFYLLMIVKYVRSERKVFLFASLLSPLFHFALLALVPVSLVFYFVKRNIPISVLIFVGALIFGQTSFVSFIGNQASSYENSFIEQRYNSYASEEGKEYMDKRYENGYKTGNWKLKSLQRIKIFLDYLLLFIIIYIVFFRKHFIVDEVSLYLLNLILLVSSISFLFANVSNGSRFNIFYIFLVLGFVLKNFKLFKIGFFNRFLMQLVTISSLLYGTMSLYASNKFISLDLLWSNLFFIWFLNS